MFNTIANIWKVEDLRRRILFTLFLLIVYRIGAFIPVPNINTDVLKLQDQANQSDVFGLLNTFSGGALFQFSIFAMGIMPYITASIIVQLVVHGCYSDVCAMGKRRRCTEERKLTQITRYGTIVLGLIQAFGIVDWI